MLKLEVGILDVSHGDFVYAVTPTGDNLVIDVGTGDVVPSIFLKTINEISELQISHPHTDHFDDIVGISKKTIKSFRCPSLVKFDDQVIGWKKSDKAKIAALRELKARIKADNAAVKAGRGFSHTVYFADNIDYKDPDTASAVTILAYKGVKLLFGGDLPASGWENLLKKSDFVSAVSGTNVFKVPLHGRQEGCCQALFDLKEFKPLLCIISDKSLEKDNKSTVAMDWYSKRASGCRIVGYDGPRKVLTTRSDGSIFIKINEKGSCWVYPNTRWRSD